MQHIDPHPAQGIIQDRHPHLLVVLPLADQLDVEAGDAEVEDAEVEDADPKKLNNP